MNSHAWFSREESGDLKHFYKELDENKTLEAFHVGEYLHERDALGKKVKGDKGDVMTWHGLQKVILKLYNSNTYRKKDLYPFTQPVSTSEET